ncbi:hypothetical protein ADK67_16960 [Saccharothrix sp. NRRL B-16348]|uniref:hypothetical protein n=1 Tax=Saccharothrix sp. NRRL B-16348 TaxID=1415542 RepID=UPI0006B01B5A|nr:hypothetical protein [Saccharothrix sp. NRRL B-16348]KOX25534.1 hypothetical protein ADK67_16960 [Saccharothrix sp. NRRL B-16348]
MDQVIKAADLKAAGVPGYLIDLKCRPGGPWQRILPGVVLLSASPPTRAQRLQAALAYAGPKAVVTGVDALHAHGLHTLPPPARIHLLQPATNRRSCAEHVLLERTTRPPKVVVEAGLPLAEPTRATLDAARHEPDPLRQHHLLSTAVRSGLCTLTSLTRELNAGSKRGTATPRATLKLLSALLR